MKIYYLICFTISIFISQEIFSQEVAPFPQSFQGHWKGTLQWLRAGKATQHFTMQLIVKPTDTTGQYTWHIMYGDEKTDSRPYLLKPIDTLKGHWIIDENNGIILDSYLHGSALHGAFTVQGNTIVDNYELISGREMKVQFFSIKLSDKKRSGHGTADSPAVDSYLISSYQQGILKKIEGKPLLIK